MLDGLLVVGNRRGVPADGQLRVAPTVQGHPIVWGVGENLRIDLDRFAGPVFGVVEHGKLQGHRDVFRRRLL